MKLRKNLKFALILISIFILSTACSNGKEFLIINKSSQTDNTEKHYSEIEEIISHVNLLAVGDIMFHSHQIRAAYDSKTGGYDFLPVFKHVQKYIEGADISIANLETVIAGGDIEYSGCQRFNAPKESVKAISEAGFDIISTANNHSLDYGKKGLINTIKTIEEYEMKNIGTYTEKETPILVEEIDGIRLGFLSYTYALNGMDFTLSSEELTFMVNKIDESKIKNDLKKAKDLDIDLIVVYIHWGYEYHMEPSEYQIELGEKIIGWGADIILGSHPHVIQKAEILNIDGEDKFIMYSMGNFLSNQMKSSLGNPYTEDGIMINLKLEKSSLTQKTKIVEIEYIPTWVNRYSENGMLIYEILPIEDVLNGDLDIKLEDSVIERIKKSLSDTLAKTKKP